MTSDERKQKEIEKIERMFKQADKSHSGFSEPEQPSIDASSTSSPPDTEVVSATEKEVSTGYNLENLAWVSSILEDLANFAEFHHLCELEACLKDTHRKVAKILQKMEKP